jgi:hypothetical protein
MQIKGLIPTAVHTCFVRANRASLSDKIITYCILVILCETQMEILHFICTYLPKRIRIEEQHRNFSLSSL